MTYYILFIETIKFTYAVQMTVDDKVVCVNRKNNIGTYIRNMKNNLLFIKNLIN